MSSFTIIRPKDDAAARQASDWADELVNRFTSNGHHLATDVDDTTPADSANILAALGGSVALVCYFGHGDEDNFLTGSSPTVSVSTIKVSVGIAIVAIACKTANNLGPAAITAGADAWLGFSVKVLEIAPHRTIDPIGDAIIAGLTVLGNGGTMFQACSNLRAELDQLVKDYDTGGNYSNHPHAGIGYFGAIAMRDHVVLHGNSGCSPL